MIIRETRSKTLVESVAPLGATIKHIKKLNLLLSHYRNFGKNTKVPTKIVTSTLSSELTSKTIIDFCKTIPPLDETSVNVRELSSLQKSIPEKFYFFLWRLKNNTSIPLEGIPNSIEFRNALYALIRSSQILRHFSEKYPAIPDVQEMCGFIYLDLAGLALHTQNGLFIDGLRFNHHKLVRRAIKYFQTGIKICKQIGIKTEGQHQSVFTNQEHFYINDKKIYVYLNPWHFIYIWSALNMLNDKKIAALYLDSARTIIKNIKYNQNPRVVSNKDLLEAIYTIIEMSEKDLTLPKEKVKKLRKSIDSLNGKNKGKKFCTPVIGDWLLKQFTLQQNEIEKWDLSEDVKKYISAVYWLYSEIPDSFQRNKIIFRLNLPQIQQQQQHEPETGFAPKSKTADNETWPAELKLVRTNSYRKAS